MSQGGFLQNLVNFPKDSINEEAVELLQPYLEMEDYNLATAKKVRLYYCFYLVKFFFHHLSLVTSNTEHFCVGTVFEVHYIFKI